MTQRANPVCDAAAYTTGATHKAFNAKTQIFQKAEGRRQYPQAGQLRCRVVPGHGVDEVRGAVAGASGGAGDVGSPLARWYPIEVFRSVANTAGPLPVRA
jgi:hypothetical protein